MDNQLSVIDQAKGLIIKNQDQIQALCGKSFEFEMFKAAVFHELMIKPELASCTPGSLMNSVNILARVGLLPGGSNGYAYLIPYNNECSVQLGYRGMIRLMKRSGEITDITPRFVAKDDEFSVLQGTTEEIRHVPVYSMEGQETIDTLEDMKAVYAIATYANGSKSFQVMSQKEVRHIRSKSKANRGGPWVSDFPEMAKKSAVRRLWKTVTDSSEEMDLAASIMDNEMDLSASVVKRQELPEQTQEHIVDHPQLVEEPQPSFDTFAHDMSQRMDEQYGREGHGEKDGKTQ